MKISEFLKSRRGELGISQADLARELTLRGQDVTRATVGHWEAGRNNPPIEDPQFRLALASALELDVNTMMVKLGFLITEAERSHEARRAADIIDQLPSEGKSLALDYLLMLEKRYVRSH